MTFNPAGVLALLTWVVAAGGVLGSAVWISHLGHLIRHRDQVVFLADLPAPAPPGAADQAPGRASR